jgi:ribosomal protein S9
MSNHSAHQTPQDIEALSDEQLESITGGSLNNRFVNAKDVAQMEYWGAKVNGEGITGRLKAVAHGIKFGLSTGDHKFRDEQSASAHPLM